MTPEQQARQQIDPALAHCGWVIQDYKALDLFQDRGIVLHAVLLSRALKIKLFPGRDMVPKTLVFAMDNSHAEDIVHNVREVFGKGNDFAKKITYQSKNSETGKASKGEELIRSFALRRHHASL